MSAPAPAPAAAKPRIGWRDVLRSLSQLKVLAMLLLGVSSGLPFMLVGNTMGLWLREAGVELTAIGFLSWVGLAYSMKFLWSPIVDRARLPLLGRLLGQRRSWIVLAQVVVGVALLGMALVQPQGGLLAFAALALVAAYASATQDIVIDAWRIESARSGDELALLSSAYQLGYRTALLLTDAWILVIAQRLGWVASYELVAALMALGIVAVLVAPEPDSRAAEVAPLWSPRGLFDAIVGPFVGFFRDHGRLALLMLLAISLYRLPDFLLGPMANPFYHDLGLSKDVVGAVRGSFGWVATTVGIIVAGVFALRFGLVATLIAGAVLGPGSNLAFAYLAHHGSDPGVFAMVMVIDNFCMGFAGVALIGYMSSLTRIGYTATQYALLSSFYALPGKFLKGLSGAVVDGLTPRFGLIDAYAHFFVITALMGIPALLLCLWLGARVRPSTPAAS